MAEAIIRHFLPTINVCSAGVAPAEQVAPLAIAVLEEAGVSTSELYAKDVSRFEGRTFDLVVTVCNNAQDRCPFFAGAKSQIHVPFDDPWEAIGSDDEKLLVYRRVRDEILNWVRATFLSR